MEPFEWLLLGVGLVVGSLLGSRGKDMVRSAAKGYMTVSEKTTQLAANAREDLRDAIEEARYEYEHEAKTRDEKPAPPALVEAKPVAKRRTRAATQSATATAPARRTRTRRVKASDEAPSP